MTPFYKNSNMLEFSISNNEIVHALIYYLFRLFHNYSDLFILSFQFFIQIVQF